MLLPVQGCHICALDDHVNQPLLIVERAESMIGSWNYIAGHPVLGAQPLQFVSAGFTQVSEQSIAFGADEC